MRREIAASKVEGRKSRFEVRGVALVIESDQAPYLAVRSSCPGLEYFDCRRVSYFNELLTTGVPRRFGIFDVETGCKGSIMCNSRITWECNV